MQSDLVNEAVGEIEKRTATRRSSDRWMFGILAGLVASVFIGGIAWGSTRAEIANKVDKADFNSFVAKYEKNRATDSLSNSFRDTLAVKIDRKLSRVLCRTNAGECQ